MMGFSSPLLSDPCPSSDNGLQFPAAGFLFTLAAIMGFNAPLLSFRVAIMGFSFPLLLISVTFIDIG